MPPARPPPWRAPRLLSRRPECAFPSPPAPPILGDFQPPVLNFPRCARPGAGADSPASRSSIWGETMKSVLARLLVPPGVRRRGVRIHRGLRGLRLQHRQLSRLGHDRRARAERHRPHRGLRERRRRQQLQLLLCRRDLLAAAPGTGDLDRARHQRRGHHHRLHVRGPGAHARLHPLGRRLHLLHAPGLGALARPRHQRFRARHRLFGGRGRHRLFRLHLQPGHGRLHRHLHSGFRPHDRAGHQQRRAGGGQRDPGRWRARLPAPERRHDRALPHRRQPHARPRHLGHGPHHRLRQRSAPRRAASSATLWATSSSTCRAPPSPSARRSTTRAR